MSPRRLDLAVAAGAAGAGVLGTAVEGRGAVTAAGCALLGAALGLYRTRPLAAGIAGVAGAGVVSSTGYLSWSSATLIIANAFPASRYGSRLVSAAIGLGLLAAALAQVAISQDGGEVPAVFLVATSWTAGLGIR